MHEELVEALRQGESSFRELCEGSFLKPLALANAILWAIMSPDLAQQVYQEYLDGKS